MFCVITQVYGEQQSKGNPLWRVREVDEADYSSAPPAASFVAKGQVRTQLKVCVTAARPRGLASG